MEKCSICGKEGKSVKYHIWRMHGDGQMFNPNKGYADGTRQGWNKGLTKETHPGVAKIAEANSIRLKGKPGRPHTLETKQKISNIRKQFLEEHPEKVPYLMNHSSNISYPERYFMECFKDVSNIVHQHPVYRYSLDFANIDEKIYLEIDGEQHYTDKRIVAHDVIRTQKLLDADWTGIRIRWSEFQKLDEIQRKEKVKEIGLLMKLAII